MQRLFALIIIAILIFSCNEGNDTVPVTKVSELLKKAESDTVPDDLKRTYLARSYNYLINNENDSVNRNLLFKVSHLYYEMGDYRQYYNVSHKLNELSVREKDTAHIAKSLYYIGDYFESNAQIDSALHYYIKSSKYYKAINDTLNLGRTMLYKAGMLYDSGNYIESEVEAINALQLLVLANNTRLIYESYNLIALSLEEQNNLEKSLEYFNLALNQLGKLENEGYPKSKVLNSRASCYNNMGGIYEKKKDYKTAINIYTKALQTKNLRDNKPQLYAMLLNNLASAKMHSNRFKDVKNLLFESLHIRDSMDLVSGTLSSKIRIGEYYLLVKDTANAVRYLKEGYKLSKEIGSHQDILKSLKLLSETDTNDKVKYSQLYIKVSDSLRNVERVTRNKFARIAYEADEIEAENELLSKRNTSIILFSGIGAIILICFFGLYRLKSHNKELLLIQEQQAVKADIYKLMLEQQSKTKAAREEERNRIAMDLHDGIVNKIFTTRFNLMQLETNQAEKKDELVKELEDAQEEIRKVSHELKQNLLFEDKSFTDLLESYIASQQPATDIKLDLYIDKFIDWQVLSTEDKVHLYRIVQEVVHNVIKHSKANTCNVTFFKKPDGIIIRIWDDGVGFDPEQLKKGIGLKNISERVHELNGVLNIKSNPGEGASIEILINTQ